MRQAYSEGLVDESVADLKGIERDAATPQPWRRERHTLITDAIGDMEGWACFHDDAAAPTKPPEVQVPASPVPPPAPTEYVPPKPFIRDQPKIGRNDPCPCGSGKKYKKCCGK